MTGPCPISEDEFAEIDEAIASTPKGRAYLRLRDKRARAVADAEFRDFASQLITDIREQLSSEGVGSGGQVSVLRRELLEMSRCIHQTRLQIAELHPAESGNSRIIAATNELDAIVSACERATSDILNAAERISEIAHEDVPGRDAAALAAEIDRHVTEILTACSFQDITGQRTTKVVNTLRYIEMRIDSMIQIWGIDGESQPMALPEDIVDPRNDSHLLNGPALDGGVRQEDVDAFFAGGPPPAEAGSAAPIAPPSDMPPAAAAKPAEPTPKPSAPAKTAPATAVPASEAKPTASAAPRKPAPRPAPEKPKAKPVAEPLPPSAVASQADIDALFA
jgi:chemotaxis regulatin CheY-phosphate phosphatase CheZ